MVEDVRWILRLVWWNDPTTKMSVWYDQQLTVVKQKCKEFVKVTIQWNWLVICSTQIQGIYFLFDVLSFLAHSCIFVSPFAEDQPQNEMNTVMDQRTNLLIKWWSNTSDGDVSYLTTDQFSKDGWKWWKMWDVYYDLYGEMIQLPRWVCDMTNSCGETKM